MAPLPRRILRLSAADHDRETPPIATNGIHFAESLVETVLHDFTNPGDRVIDPFAGYGTTVLVADRIGRQAVGIELQAHRVEYASTLLREESTSRMLCADARDLASLNVGEFDLCLTSPPYMTACDHPEDPLDAYRTHAGDYSTYLAGLTEIFHHVGARMREGGHIVVNVATLRVDDEVTTLAWDLGRELSREFAFQGEIYLDWDVASSFVAADYCLVFRVTGTSGGDTRGRRSPACTPGGEDEEVANL